MATGDIYFHIKGTSATAFRSLGAHIPAPLTGNETVATAASTIGNSYLDFNTTAAGFGSRHSLTYPGRGNFAATQGFSVLARVQFKALTFDQALWSVYQSGDVVSHYASLYWSFSATALRCGLRNDSGSLVHNNVGGTWAPSTDVWYDIFFRTSGATGGANTKLIVDDATVASLTPAFVLDSVRNTNRDHVIQLGWFSGINQCSMWLNEFVVFEGEVDQSTVALVGGGSGLIGAARTEFVNSTALNATLYSDPLVANVKSGESYTYAGVNKTGSYSPASGGGGGSAQAGIGLPQFY